MVRSVWLDCCTLLTVSHLKWWPWSFYCCALRFVWNWAVSIADEVYLLLGSGVYINFLTAQGQVPSYYTSDKPLTAPWIVRIATGRSLSITICSSKRFWTWRTNECILATFAIWGRSPQHHHSPPQNQAHQVLGEIFLVYLLERERHMRKQIVWRKGKPGRVHTVRQ